MNLPSWGVTIHKASDGIWVRWWWPSRRVHAKFVLGAKAWMVLHSVLEIHLWKKTENPFARPGRLNQDPLPAQGLGLDPKDN